MNESDVKIGDKVWYVVGQDRQLAVVVALSGSTHARIRLQTGPQAGMEIDAPWGIIETYSAPKS